MAASKLNLEGKAVLVTGSAGFIGSHLAKKLCQDMPDTQIIGIDNLNDYYDIGLKESRLNDLSTYLIGLYNILEACRHSRENDEERL